MCTELRVGYAVDGPLQPVLPDCSPPNQPGTPRVVVRSDYDDGIPFFPLDAFDECLRFPLGRIHIRPGLAEIRSSGDVAPVGSFNVAVGNGRDRLSPVRFFGDAYEHAAGDPAFPEL